MTPYNFRDLLPPIAQMGAYYKATPSLVAVVAGTAKQFIGPNPQRYAFLVSAGSTANAVIAPDGIALTGSQGLFLGSSGFIVVKWSDLPAAPGLAWNIFTIANVNVLVLDISIIGI